MDSLVSRHPEAALADADRAIVEAREIGQAATLMYALGHAPFTYFLCGEHTKGSVVVDELAALADEKSALFWKACAMLNRGWLYSVTGKAADAVRMIRSGLTAWRSTGAGAWIPFYLSHLASAYAALGQFDDGASARQWPR